MKIDFNKLQDNLYLKDIINLWYKDLSSNNQSVILETLMSIYKVILYVKKDEMLFNKFKFNFSTISKLVYNNIYTSIPLIRLYVVKIANLMDYKDLIIDIMNYLKLENDVECLKEYLEFIKKFGYIGYIDEVLNLLNKDSSFIVNIKVLEVVLYLSINYRNNSKYIDKAFEILINYYNSKYPRWEHFFINFFDSFLGILNYIYQNKEKLNSVFVFEFCNYFIYKLLNFINQFVNDLDSENKIQIINIILLDIAFLLKIIQDLLNFSSNLRSYVNDKIDEEKYFTKVNLSKLIYYIYSNLKEKSILKYFFLVNFINNKENFKNFLRNKNEESMEEERNVLNDFISELIRDFKETQTDRLRDIILDFINEFNLVLSDSNLEMLVEGLFSYSDNVILKILDIVKKNNFKVVFNILLKLINSKNLEISNKVKEILREEN
ncbi:MAG: hypothetical protein ACP5RD_02385 [bacterium]